MGYAWKGVCYQDTASALNAFVRDVPMADASGINTFTSMPSIDGTGVISWSISNRPLNTGAATTQTGTTQLITCSTEGMNQWSEQSVIWIVALFLAAMFGFRTGFRA